MTDFYDCIIVGGGPAGLTAAIYLARAKYRVLVVEKGTIGGQITITSEVVNYPGILKTDGISLTNSMKKQAEAFGAEFLSAEVKELSVEGGMKTVLTDKGPLRSLGIVLATGASPRKAGFQGEEAFRGRGVAYCATCDGEFFSGLDIFVIGGGFAAAEEAVFLTKYARKIHMIIRGEKFSCAASAADEVLSHPDIQVHFHTRLLEAGGQDRLQYAVFEEESRIWRYEPENGEGFGIFVFAGYEPANQLFRDKLALTDDGYLITDMNQKTSVDGVYGAGDICVKNLRQVVTAVSDGASAAAALEKYISAQYEKQKLPRREVQKKSSPSLEKASSGHEPKGSQSGFLDANVKKQLIPVLERLEKAVTLEFYLDSRQISREAEAFGRELQALSPKIRCRFMETTENSAEAPSIRFCSEDGTYLGTAFHGVPGGHEFNSFVIALYNAAGPGQPIDAAILERLKSLRQSHHIQVVVSLSCTMCPELVMAVQRIALESGAVTADIYDMAHFPAFKDNYRIMSVPCMIIDEKDVNFGKKGIEEVLALL